MIFKFIFFLTIYSSIANCCTIDEDDIDGSRSHLKLANTIILGSIKRVDHEQYFISKKPWRNIKLKVSKNTCGGYLIGSGDVVFSSRKTIDELVKSNESIGITNGSFSNMISFANHVNDILDKEELPVGQPNYFWKYCTEDTSCTDVVGRCGERFGINKNNQISFENYLKKKKKYKCSESTTRKKSSCINNFCS